MASGTTSEQRAKRRVAVTIIKAVAHSAEIRLIGKLDEFKLHRVTPDLGVGVIKLDVGLALVTRQRDSAARQIANNGVSAFGSRYDPTAPFECLGHLWPSDITVLGNALHKDGKPLGDRDNATTAIECFNELKANAGETSAQLYRLLGVAISYGSQLGGLRHSALRQLNQEFLDAIHVFRTTDFLTQDQVAAAYMSKDGPGGVLTSWATEERVKFVTAGANAASIREFETATEALTELTKRRDGHADTQERLAAAWIATITRSPHATLFASGEELQSIGRDMGDAGSCEPNGALARVIERVVDAALDWNLSDKSFEVSQ